VLLVSATLVTMAGSLHRIPSKALEQFSWREVPIKGGMGCALAEETRHMRAGSLRRAA
jgi:hypothetical protein